MAATTPWVTTTTQMGWAAGGATILFYPVNDMPSLNPLALDAAPGRRWIGNFVRMQNRYTSAGRGGVSCNIDMTGQSASATAWYGAPLMEAAGFAVSGTTGKIFTLASPLTGLGNLVPADLEYSYSDGTRRRIQNAVGGCVFNISAGEIPNMTFDGVGQLGVAETDSLTVTAPPFGQAVQGCSFTIDDTVRTMDPFVFVARSAVIATNPVIAMRRSVAGTGGYAIPTITGYEPTMNLLIELDNATLASDSAVFDFESYFSSDTLADNNLTVSLAIPAGGLGTHADGNVITVTGVFRLDGQPQREDDGEGVMCLRVPLILKQDVIGTPNSALTFTWS